MFVCVSCVLLNCLFKVKPKTHTPYSGDTMTFCFIFLCCLGLGSQTICFYCETECTVIHKKRYCHYSFLLLFVLLIFQTDHVRWSEIMTLLNESDETSPPSFPLLSLEHNFSVLVTHDPSDLHISFPTSPSSSLTSSNCTTSPSASSAPYNFYAVLLVLLIFCVVFGNVLVCVAVSRERALQTTTNYLIVSLAVSDLLLATLVMPWGVYMEVCQCLFVYIVCF